MKPASKPSPPTKNASKGTPPLRLDTSFLGKPKKQDTITQSTRRSLAKKQRPSSSAFAATTTSDSAPNAPPGSSSSSAAKSTAPPSTPIKQEKKKDRRPLTLNQCSSDDEEVTFVGTTNTPRSPSPSSDNEVTRFSSSFTTPPSPEARIFADFKRRREEYSRYHPKNKNRRARRRSVEDEGCELCGSRVTDECHEELYGQFCFSRAQAAIRSSNPTLTEAQLFEMFSALYTDLDAWEAYKMGRDSRSFSSTGVDIPVCLLAKSFTVARDFLREYRRREE